MDQRRRGPDDDRARRKLRNLLAGDYLLYEVTAGRELRVLRFPRRTVAVTRPAGAAGRAFPTEGGGARPAP
jgi:hypothetical protein